MKNEKDEGGEVVTMWPGDGVTFRSSQQPNQLTNAD